MPDRIKPSDLVATGAVSAPLWWQSFADAVGIYIPPLIAIATLIYMALRVVELLDHLRRHWTPAEDEEGVE